MSNETQIIENEIEFDMSILTQEKQIIVKTNASYVSEYKNDENNEGSQLLVGFF